MSVEGDSNNELDQAVTAAVETALTTVFSERHMMLEAFTGMCNFIGPDGTHRFVMFTPDDQLHAATCSLTRFMAMWNDEVTRLGIHDMLINLPDDEMEN